MRYKLFTLAICGLISSVFSLTMQAQGLVPEPYFTAIEMPDMVKWFNAPPKDGSDEFIRDVKRYYWGKSQRLESNRAAIAICDAQYGLATIIKEFSTPFGMQISHKKTPEIYKLLLDALATTDSICKLPKITYMRTRPFMVFDEPTLTPDDEPFLRKNGSYPSGHTILGWSAALLLSEINPQNADTILARGLIYGESRVIVGAHWQSDVDAGRLAASVAYAKLHTSDRFLKQMAVARKEFEKLKGKFPPVVNENMHEDSIAEYQKEISYLEAIESRYQCKIQRFPFGFDETTGLKTLYIKCNRSPYHVANGVDYVVLSNKEGEIVYVVKSVMRHDVDDTENNTIYGLYVIGKDVEGEIEVSSSDYRNFERLIFQMGDVPEFVNCSSIKFRVAGVSHLIPFTPISENERQYSKRFFCD